MGYRLHYATKYQVEYEGGHFNHKQEEINILLHEYCDGLSWDGDFVEYSDRLEVPRSELIALIYEISKDREKFEEWIKEHDFDYSPEDLIAILAEWIAKSDSRNDFVVLSWF